ncbi:hypothetical protein [Alteromonas lipolytica]|uniref:HBM domain-containing protein n=1 Tax=Alteromonas lipolytica TaxID=1856405 RepID=A0A1E8FK48_9ALTE|nr:hypothetical protein [Alteromonas lipolytica]OFI36284.1 hypothetical protein BFC17_09195 [Alteromonas lipolytica]GGF79403.1 hypothetical protein GCM10011338_34700 [Alteromonas lipolytica]
MKWDSIKSRLLLMTMLCVLGMGLMTVNQHYFGQKLSALNADNVALQQLQTDLLQLRRHEKDFLLRHNNRYLQRFREQQVTFTASINTLDKVIQQYQLPATLVGDIASDTELYVRYFYQLADLMRVYGLNSATGISGDLRELSMKLNSSSVRLPKDLIHLPGQIVYLAADFQLTFDETTQSTLLALLSSLITNDRVPADYKLLLQEFREKFNQLVATKKKIGFSEQQGLRGLFREQAHRVEDNLAKLDAALQPVLVEHKQQATLYSTAIALLTSVALILLLIRSFATFHRSFANFVLFFYRCKRQYQRIDPKQLGFSEFRLLAALANEMVESRRQIERRLEKLEAASAANGGVAPKHI